MPQPHPNQPKTITVLISISSFFVMLFMLGVINTYEQTLIEAKNHHFGGATHQVVDKSSLHIKHSSQHKRIHAIQISNFQRPNTQRNTTPNASWAPMPGGCCT